MSWGRNALLSLMPYFSHLNVFFQNDNCSNNRLVVIFTARKRSLGQGNVFTPVCHSVQGGGVLPNPPLDADSQGWADPLPGCRPTPRVRQTPQMQTPSRLGRTPWMQTPLGLGRPPDANPPRCRSPPRCRPHPHDTVNKRLVCILLECILVILFVW